MTTTDVPVTIDKDDWRDGLTLHQQRFVEEYLEDLNASAAVRRMNPRARKESSRQIGNRYKRNPKVFAAIQKAFAARGVTKLRVMEEASAAAFADITDFVTIETDPETGRQKVVIKDTSELTPEQCRAIGAISQTTNEFGTTIKVTPIDKMSALQFIAKAMGHTVDKHEVSGTVTHNVSVKELKNELNNWFDNLRDNLLTGGGVPIGPGQTLLPPVNDKEKLAAAIGK